MNPLKWIRKIGKFVRGGATPLQILLACVLGTILGIVPGFTALHAVLIVLVLVINVSIGLTILTFAIGKAMMFLLAPVSAAIGRFVILDMGLQPLFRTAGDTPVVALMRLTTHAVPGGILLGILLGLLIGFLIARIVILLRKGLVTAKQKSPRAARVAAMLPVRILLALLFGRQKRPLEELLSQRSPVFRRWGIVVAAGFLVLLLVGLTVAVDFILAGQIESALAKVNGAEVNVRKADLAILQGRVRIEGLQVTDRKKPTHNLVAAGEISSDISIRGLLTGRVIIDELAAVEGVVGGLRETPGEVYPQPEPEPGPTPQDVLWDWFENPEKIREQIERARKLKEWLEKIRQRIEARKKDVPPPPDPNQPYLERNSDELLTQHPSVLIRRIRIDSIRIADDQTAYRLEARNVSSAPDLVSDSMVIRIGDIGRDGDELVLGRQFHINLAFNFADPQTLHEADIRIPKVPLGEFFTLSDKSSIQIDKGLATLTSKGGFSARKLDLATTIQVRQFNAGSSWASTNRRPTASCARPSNCRWWCMSAAS